VAPSSPGITVRDNPEASRYEAFVDGALAGFAVYRLAQDRVVFVHTEIHGAYAGQGVGSVLAGTALEDVRVHGKQVIPLCPFIASYIRRHPDYLDLVDDEHRDAFRTAAP
jgi:hypothetical protein